jgi:hypothetical protein
MPLPVASVARITSAHVGTAIDELTNTLWQFEDGERRTTSLPHTLPATLSRLNRVGGGGAPIGAGPQACRAIAKRC